MRNLIKKLFNLYEYKSDPDYSVFSLSNLATYLKLHEMITGEQLKELRLKPDNYTFYKDFLFLNAASYRGIPVTTKIKIKKTKSKNR